MSPLQIAMGTARQAALTCLTEALTRVISTTVAALVTAAATSRDFRYRADAVAKLACSSSVDFCRIEFAGSDLTRSRRERAARPLGEIVVICRDPFASRRASKISRLSQIRVFQQYRRKTEAIARRPAPRTTPSRRLKLSRPRLRRGHALGQIQHFGGEG